MRWFDLRSARNSPKATELPAEFDLIAWIRKYAQQFPSSLIRHIGDDGAVFDPRFAHSLVVTTDMLIENVHFKRHWISPGFLGRKTLAVNLSDLAAMGARPYACLLALALPSETTGEYFYSFMTGFLEEAERRECPLIGGDLSAGPVVGATVTAWGSVASGSAIYRAGARLGDEILLVGEVGLSRLGVQMLNLENPTGLAEIDCEDKLAQWAGDLFRFRCLKAHFLPDPQVEVGSWLQQNQLATAMIDVSDGLAADLGHIARESAVAAEIDCDALPLPEELNAESALDVVLNGGEDYALLFTCSQAQLAQIHASYPSTFPAFRPIGRIVSDEPGVYLTRKGERERYEPRGYDHFRS